MDTEGTKEVTPVKKKVSAQSKQMATLKRVDIETARQIQQLKDKANRKQYGRKVRDAEIIAIAIKNVTPEHIKELQEATLSQNDRLRMLHEDYQKTNGKLSLDQFIGKLLTGEIVRPEPGAGN